MSHYMVAIDPNSPKYSQLQQKIVTTFKYKFEYKIKHNHHCLSQYNFSYWGKMLPHTFESEPHLIHHADSRVLYCLAQNNGMSLSVPDRLLHK